MSEQSGRAANGGARTGGPQPVPLSGASPGIRPPTEIMRQRNAREQAKAEEQRRLAEERRRRENAAQRAAALQGTAAPRNSGTSSQYTPESAQQPFDRRSGTAPVAGSQALGDPTGRTTEYPSSRVRGTNVSQDQPRPAPAAAGASRRTQPTQPASRPAPPSAGAGASASGEPSAPQPENSGGREGAVTFPHAFHRWETLSSHWEGLTSFWLRRLEENTEKIRETLPNITTLNRQITDLSAAGANLFHAVVELQRLRASSERKFQRWFFDTKGESEKHRELQGQLENQLKLEREEANRGRADLLMQAENAKREAAEVRRELAISKDEARRAWEELGRRNQESLETAQSLKDGRITIVHGVQVVPYLGGASRSGSASQRPVTRDGPGYYGSTGGGYASPGDEREYYYNQEGSPTNTDPFMETAPTVQAYSDPNKQSYQPSYGVGGTPTTSSTAQTAIPTGSQRVAPVTTQDAQRFYQHDPHETYLHGSSGQPAQPPRGDIPGQSEASYVSSSNEGGPAPGPDYITNPDGSIARDSDGRPLTHRRPTGNSPDDDDYDTEADIRREDEYSARYGTGLLPPEAPTVPSTSSQAMASYGSATAQGQSLHPDYEGAGYGGSGSATWDTLQQGRHHHPTRLSDVLEEEEERSSRTRTGE